MYKKVITGKLLAAVIMCFSVLSCATSGSVKKAYGEIAGNVEKIGRHDRAVTDILFSKMEEAGYTYGDIIRVVFQNGYTFTAPIVKNYEVPTGSPCVKKESSSGYVSFAINYADISRIGSIKAGDKFILSMIKKSGYQKELNSRHLTYSHKRDDFESDYIFANCREITFDGVIAPKTLYRGSHPTKTKWARAPYVSQFMEKAEIKTVINIGDSKESLQNDYLSDSNEFASRYYKSLFENNSVICLAINRNYTEDAFMSGIVKGLTFMANNPPPYYFHCTEGKDRTGFMGILIGALMGAKTESIYSDYMESFVNYYSLKKGSKNYNIILSETAVPILEWITNKNTDISSAAEEFLLKHGMKKEDLMKLKERLKA